MLRSPFSHPISRFRGRKKGVTNPACKVGFFCRLDYAATIGKICTCGESSRKAKSGCRISLLDFAHIVEKPSMPRMPAVSTPVFCCTRRPSTLRRCGRLRSRTACPSRCHSRGTGLPAPASTPGPPPRSRCRRR